MCSSSPDVIDVKDETSSRECAALWYAMSDGLGFRVCVFSVCGLRVVSEVGSQESNGVVVKVESMA
jgi:hypothetical protein